MLFVEIETDRAIGVANAGQFETIDLFVNVTCPYQSSDIVLQLTRLLCT